MQFSVETELAKLALILKHKQYKYWIHSMQIESDFGGIVIHSAYQWRTEGVHN